jgi:hypothetical protein
MHSKSSIQLIHITRKPMALRPQVQFAVPSFHILVIPPVREQVPVAGLAEARVN